MVIYKQKNIIFGVHSVQRNVWVARFLGKNSSLYKEREKVRTFNLTYWQTGKVKDFEKRKAPL